MVGLLQIGSQGAGHAQHGAVERRGHEAEFLVDLDENFGAHRICRVAHVGLHGLFLLQNVVRVAVHALLYVCESLFQAGHLDLLLILLLLYALPFVCGNTTATTTALGEVVRVRIVLRRRVQWAAICCAPVASVRFGPAVAREFAAWVAHVQDDAD